MEECQDPGSGIDIPGSVTLYHVHIMYATYIINR
jgi:hypothetical protein